jgi:hypothetical protein
MNYPQISSPMREGIHPLGSLILLVSCKEPLAMHAHLHFTRGHVTTHCWPTDTRPFAAVLSVRCPSLLAQCMWCWWLETWKQVGTILVPPPPKFLVSLLQKKIAFWKRHFGSNLTTKVSVLRHVCVLLWKVLLLRCEKLLVIEDIT